MLNDEGKIFYNAIFQLSISLANTTRIHHSKLHTDKMFFMVLAMDYSVIDYGMFCNVG